MPDTREQRGDYDTGKDERYWNSDRGAREGDYGQGCLLIIAVLTLVLVADLYRLVHGS